MCDSGFWRAGLPRLSLIMLPLVLAGSVHGGRSVVDTSASPHVEFRNTGMEAVRWTEGFWAERFELCRNVTIPALIQVMQKPDNSANFQNFRIAAGRAEGKFFGRDWGDGDCYKLLEAVAALYWITRDPELDRWMDQWIQVIGKAQAPDGYISTQIQLTGRPPQALVEFVDIYPSLCELAGLPLPSHLEGTSFAPLLDAPQRPWKKAAFRQYPRGGGVMGYSRRTDRYRLTRWLNRNGTEAAHELYDHQNDPQENVNVADRPENEAMVEELTQQMQAGWKAVRAGLPGVAGKLAENQRRLCDYIRRAGFDYAARVYRGNLAAHQLDALKYHPREWVTQGALDFLEQAGDKPFFLHLCTTLQPSPAPNQSLRGDAAMKLDGRSLSHGRLVELAGDSFEATPELLGRGSVVRSAGGPRGAGELD